MVNQPVFEWLDSLIPLKFLEKHHNRPVFCDHTILAFQGPLRSVGAFRVRRAVRVRLESVMDVRVRNGCQGLTRLSWSFRALRVRHNSEGLLGSLWDVKK